MYIFIYIHIFCWYPFRAPVIRLPSLNPVLQWHPVLFVPRPGAKPRSGSKLLLGRVTGHLGDAHGIKTRSPSREKKGYPYSNLSNLEDLEEAGRQDMCTDRFWEWLRLRASGEFSLAILWRAEGAKTRSFTRRSQNE